MKTIKPPRSLTRIFPQVKKIILSKKPVIVQVTPKDCKDGKKFDSNECALAKATKRQFKADGVAIRMTDSYIVKGSTAIRFRTPTTVGRELVSFDRNKDFASGTYRLSAAPPTWSKPPVRGKVGGKRGTYQPQKVHHHTVRVRTVNNEERQER